MVAFPAFGSDEYWQYFAYSPSTAITDLARHLVLPVTTLVLISVAGMHATFDRA